MNNGAAVIFFYILCRDWFLSENDKYCAW